MLPVDFTDRMSNILGNEYDDFISSYNKPRFHSLRINPLKTSINEFTNNFKYSFTLVFSLEILAKYEGMSDGFIKGTIRLWPYKLNGEGHFVAMLKKSGV